MDLVDLPATGSSEDRLDPRDVIGHVLLVQPLRTGTTQGKYGEQPHVDLNVVDLDDSNRLYTGVRFFGGALHDPLSAVLGKTLAVVPELRTPKSSAAQPYAGLRAADPAQKARAVAFKDANPDPFNSVADLPAEQPSSPQQGVSGGLATTGQGTSNPSAEQTVASALGATPVQEAAPAGPTAADIATAKTLIGVPGIEDATILASCPSLNPAIVASLRTAAAS